MAYRVGGMVGGGCGGADLAYVGLRSCMERAVLTPPS